MRIFSRGFLLYGILASTILFQSSSSLAATPPKGAIKLTTSKLFSVGTVRCGQIRNQWIPGRLISGGYFYSRTAERNNIIKQAKKSSGAKKRKLLRQAANLLTKRQIESLSCVDGPPSQPTPAPTQTPGATETPGSNPTPSPTTTTTPTPTSTPTPEPTIALQQINANLYYTEHSIYIIPPPEQVTWTGPSSWNSVYESSNMNSYVNTLKTNFPDDYFFVTITASNLLPDNVPNVLTFRGVATGIGLDSFTATGVPNICRYNAGTGPILGVFGVLDHEIGHNWGNFIGSELVNGHWRENSNAEGQMANNYSDDGFATVKRIRGNPTDGFTWVGIPNAERNETEIFSDHDLYLQGLNNSFPDFYVLNSPVYNSNGTVSHSGVTTYDQAWVEARNGVRNPTYRTSEKRFRFGFIYVARDLTEVNNVYIPIEKSIRHFVYNETIDRNLYRSQIPYLPLTKFRASVNARLADLDGNQTPTISITGATYLTTSTGSTFTTYTASDPDGVPPTVSCVPASANCSISGSTVNLTGLTVGSHFFTIKAEDAGGKKSFAHFVVDQS